MPLFFLSIIIQVALVIHVVKTGRNTIWIWIVVMLPIAGSIAYFIIEVLPGITGSHAARRTRSSLSKTFNPDKELKLAVQNLNMSDTVENSLNLASECLSKGKFEEAKSLYQRCLTGVHKDDPHIMQGLAEAEFGLENYADTKDILDELISSNPDYKSAEAHLLYARALEELGQTREALHEYEALDRYFPGPEATYRYGKLLQSVDQQDKATQLFEKILQEAQQAGKHYNNIYDTWIKLSKQEL